MSNDNVTDFFNRVGGKTATPAPAPAAPAKSLKAYRAFVPFVEGRERQMLTTYYGNGRKEHWSYFPAPSNVMTDDGATYIGVLFGTGGVWIEGQDLDAIFNAFKDNGVSELHFFDPTKYERPAKDQPVSTLLQ